MGEPIDYANMKKNLQNLNIWFTVDYIYTCITNDNIAYELQHSIKYRISLSITYEKTKL